ncbi:unnamed protein product [Chironomus riparius]|uniref:Uncharacterized protein n=1 Tax=Chironomus riparius TaxID=315576 RepID=A0A9P0IYR2_9DIPT|nr:unnamed protein product [Chironomus riparius]
MKLSFFFIFIAAILIAFTSASSIVFLAKPPKPRSEHQQHRAQHHHDQQRHDQQQHEQHYYDQYYHAGQQRQPQGY